MAAGAGLRAGRPPTIREPETSAARRAAVISIAPGETKGIDLVPWIEYEGAVGEPLPHLLTDA